MICVKDVSYYVAGRHLLEDINFQISDREHIGLVGRNGTGKTTLFKIIEDRILPDSGKIETPAAYKILSIKQEIPSGEISVIDYLLQEDKERHDLFLELETCEDAERMSEIYDRLMQIDAYSAQARAAVVLNGLGFDEEAQGRPLDSFSGGYKMRIALASALFQQPDLLLLDEPTNHLDLETSDWLREFLKKYPKSFLLISHDRDFLNSSVDAVFHLKDRRITRYSGNFDTFLDVYTMKQKNALAFNQKMEEKRKHMLDYVKRFGAKATKAKQAQSRLKAIEKMKFMPIDEQDPTVEFNFPEPEKASQILSYDNVTLAYGEKIVLKNISGTILPDDRIAVVGANGNGKTTFAKFLAGELKQKKGTIERNSKLQIAFYTQNLFEKLERKKTLFEHIQALVPSFSEQHIRSHLGGFGFSGDRIFQKISEISGGERARLVFASLTLNAPNLLILDEPTNHLDIEMRESLISTLIDYKGAVILITHDRSFLNRVANSIWVVENAKITTFLGDMNSYHKVVGYEKGR